jgi:hypothetical protein
MLNALGDAAKAVTGLLPAVSRNMRATLLLTVCAALLIGAWHAPQILDAEDARTILARQLEADRQIGAELSRTLIDTQSDRIVVRQLHNGRHSLLNVPFLYATATHVRTQAGVSWEPADASPAPLDAFNSILTRMWDDPSRPVCMTASAAEVGAAARYHERGVTASIHCPVTDLRGQPLGVISAEYVRRADNPTTAAVINRLNVAAAKVAGYLVPRN